MIIFAIKLLLAHVVGDFVLQPLKGVIDKQQRKHKSPFLYIHVLIHAVLVFALLQFQWSLWPVVIIIGVTHFFIDLTKLNLDGRVREPWLFLLDQIAHLAVIAGLVYVFYHGDIQLYALIKPEYLLLTLGVVSATFAAAILIQILLSRWKVVEDDPHSSLKNAGKYIGMLERLLVFVFVILQQWLAIGFLLAAKSVFRFGDLSRAKDRKLTEYILIGTLLSFGIAVLIGLGCRQILDHWG